MITDYHYVLSLTSSSSWCSTWTSSCDLDHSQPD